MSEWFRFTFRECVKYFSSIALFTGSCVVWFSDFRLDDGSYSAIGFIELLCDLFTGDMLLSKELDGFLLPELLCSYQFSGIGVKDFAWCSFSFWCIECIECVADGSSCALELQCDLFHIESLQVEYLCLLVVDGFFSTFFWFIWVI